MSGPATPGFWLFIMQRRDINLTIGVCASLILHVGFLAYGANRYARQGGHLYLPPIWHREDSVVVSLKDPSKPDLPVHDELGESTGTGIGSNASEGDQPLKAQEADEDQAFLSRDPAGPNHVGVPPTEYAGPIGEGGVGGQIGAFAARPPDHVDEPAAPPTTPPSASPDPAPPPQPAARLKALEPPPSAEIKVTAATPPTPDRAVPIPGAGKGDKPIPAADAVAQDAGSDSSGPKPLNQSKAQSPIPDPQQKSDLVALSAPIPAPPPPDIELGKDAPQALPPGRLQPDAIASAAIAITPPVAAPRIASPMSEAAPPAPAAQHVPSRPTTGDGRAPGRPSAADPAPLSDTESDAFAKIGSAVFHNGKLSVRQGRKVRTTRPQILVPGLLDTLGLDSPTVVLKIAIDPTGKVTNVEIFRSSGSNDLDQPCLRAVYDWWFEPARDARGNPISDAILFGISFR